MVVIPPTHRIPYYIHLSHLLSLFFSSSWRAALIFSGLFLSASSLEKKNKLAKVKPDWEKSLFLYCLFFCCCCSSFWSSYRCYRGRESFWGLVDSYTIDLTSGIHQRREYCKRWDDDRGRERREKKREMRVLDHSCSLSIGVDGNDGVWWWCGDLVDDCGCHHWGRSTSSCRDNRNKTTLALTADILFIASLPFSFWPSITLDDGT